MRPVRGGEHDGALLSTGGSQAVVHVMGRQKAEAAVMMLGVDQGKKSLQNERESWSPSTPSTSSSNIRCRSCCMLCLAKTSNVSHVGLDVATDSVLFSLTGGVSFCSGVDRARGSYGEPKVTPPSLVCTPSDLTSPGDPITMSTWFVSLP